VARVGCARAPGKALSAADIARYDTDGYLCPLPAIPATEAQRLRARLEARERAAGGPFRGHLRHKVHLLLPWLWDLMCTPAILDAAEDLLGPDLLCWSTSFFTKEAGDPSFVSWHQDATYWGLSSPEVVTAWVALSPSTIAAGAMRVIPGSHRRQLAHRDTFAEHNLLTRGQEVAADVDPAEAVDLVLAPGEMSLHHVLIVHGSEPNRSADRRIGFAMRYIPTRVRQVAGARDSAALVRGVDTYRHFEPEQRPTAEFEPEAVARHRELTAAQAQTLYRGTDKQEFRA
jgi:non-haem Fe2+, alpha-ketoglutarate-dependent halogenase